MRLAVSVGVVALLALAATARAESNVPVWAVGKWVGKVSWSPGVKDDPNRILVINEKGDCYFGLSDQALGRQPDCAVGKDSITFGTSAGSSYVLKLNGEKLDGTAQYTKVSRSYRISLSRQ